MPVVHNPLHNLADIIFLQYSLFHTCQLYVSFHDEKLLLWINQDHYHLNCLCNIVLYILPTYILYNYLSIRGMTSSRDHLLGVALVVDDRLKGPKLAFRYPFRESIAELGSAEFARLFVVRPSEGGGAGAAGGAVCTVRDGEGRGA